MNHSSRASVAPPLGDRSPASSVRVPHAALSSRTSRVRPSNTPTTQSTNQPDVPKERDVQALIAEFAHFSETWLHRVSEAGISQEGPDLIMQALSRVLHPPQTPVTDPASLRSHIRAFILANLHRRISLADLSRFLGYSEKYCSEWFLSHMGISFSTYLKRLRIARAKRLLAVEHLAIAQISDWLGFSDQFAFSHFFKKTMGCSPRAYRQRLLKANPCLRSNSRS
ncbi:MAG: AraC family transcriptional regulator [Nitrospirae bacterium]|nr:MAG: AraC family transcriptional regulator [Nitrospirota bacterium]